MVVVELTFMPNVLVLLLSVREGSPAWEGKGGKWVRGWAERSKTCIRLVLLGALRPAWTDSEDVGNGLRLSEEAAWTSLRGSLWCSPECPLKQDCCRKGTGGETGGWIPVLSAGAASVRAGEGEQ